MRLHQFVGHISGKKVEKTERAPGLVLSSIIVDEGSREKPRGKKVGAPPNNKNTFVKSIIRDYHLPCLGACNSTTNTLAHLAKEKFLALQSHRILKRDSVRVFCVVNQTRKRILIRPIPLCLCLVFTGPG